MLTQTDDVHLVVGDAHVAPDQNLRRFTWANRFIHDCPFIKRIIIIGDFVTMDSLSAWDKDKRKKMEGRRYQADIQAGKRALNLLLDGVDNDIELVYTEGNHEERTSRYLDYHPELDGTLRIEDNLLDETRSTGRKITYVPYKQDWIYRSVSYTHVPIQESGKPVSGKYALQRALGIHQNSVVFGHTHKFGIACEHRHNASHLNQALNVGCFFEHVDEYAKGSITSYWRGLVLVSHYSENRFDFATCALGRLKEIYS